MHTTNSPLLLLYLLLMLFGFWACKKDGSSLPCGDAAYNDAGTIPLSSEALASVPYIGNEKLHFRQTVTGRVITFIPRQTALFTQPQFNGIEFPYTCNGDRAVMEYQGETARLSYLSNEGHVLNYFLNTGAVQVQDNSNPILVDILTIELHQPKYDFAGQLIEVVSCASYFLAQARAQQYDNTLIIDAHDLLMPVETIDRFTLGNKVFNEVFARECMDYKEVIFGEDLSLLGFVEQSGVAWVFEEAEPYQIAKAPNFLLDDLEGQPIQLYDQDAEVYILYFWASWSIPSINQIKESLTPIWEDYQNRNLQIIAISIDDNKTAWEQAIGEVNAPWVHVSDLQGNLSPILKDYQVSGLPSLLVLDQEWGILARDLYGDPLRQFLESLLMP